jgi:hypothetical protein
VPGRVCRVGCGYPGGGDEQRAYRGSRGRRAGRRDAGLGVSLGLLARALTGIPAIWPAVGGVSPAPSSSRAPQAGSGASARSSGARSIAGSPHAAGVMLMPDSRQPDDGAGKYPEMPMCENSTTRHVFPACLTLGGGASFPICQARRRNSRDYGRCIHFGAGRGYGHDRSGRAGGVGGAVSPASCWQPDHRGVSTGTAAGRAGRSRPPSVMSGCDAHTQVIAPRVIRTR